MKSKNLSKQDREVILYAVREEAERRWNESPLAEEMEEAQRGAQQCVDRIQLLHIPEDDRFVLDKYGARYGTEIHRYSIGEDGKYGRVVFRMTPEGVTRLKLKWYSPLTANSPGPSTLRDALKTQVGIVLLEHLTAYHNLYQRRACEVKEIVDAHADVLAIMNTTKQVAEDGLLGKYLPDDLRNWTPTKRTSPDADALARVKAFASGDTDGDK